MTARLAQLLGSESTVLAEVAAQADERAGFALSRGRFPKPAARMDPNEDAVLAVAEGDRWLLIAADRNFGLDAARAATEAIRASAAGDAGRRPRRRLVVRVAFRRARDAVTVALSACDESNGGASAGLWLRLVSEPSSGEHCVSQAVEV